MFIVAQIFGILVIITNVLAMQMKDKKQIILLFVFANLFSAINFLLLQSYTGTIICVFAIVQTLVNKVFENKSKNIPIGVILCYVIISIILGLLTFASFIDIIPIICSILYTITIIQKEEKNIRRITLVNIILWIVYDIICLAYTAALSDSLTTISTLVGMYRLDYKREKK